MASAVTWNDPLDADLKWIRHLQRHQPHQLLGALHETTYRYQDDERYRNDPRYVSLWHQYASFFHDPELVYQWIKSKRIGEDVGTTIHVATYCDTEHRLQPRERGSDNNGRLLGDAYHRTKQNLPRKLKQLPPMRGISIHQVPKNLSDLVDWIEFRLAYDSRAAMLRRCYKEQLIELSFEEIRAQSYQQNKQGRKIKKRRHRRGEAMGQSAQRLRVVEHPRTLPLSPNFVRHILSSLSIPLTAYTGYHTYREQNAPRERIKSKVRLGDITYTVISKLGEGGMGKVYRIEHSSEPYALKIETPPNPWEFYIMRQLEVRSVLHCTYAHSFHHYENTGLLIMDMKEGMTLLEALNFYREQFSQQQMPEPLVIYIAAKLLSITSKLHKASIVHGDLKTDNVMIHAYDGGDVCLTLIDFGRSVDLTLLPSSPQLKAGWQVDDSDYVFLSQEIAWPAWKIDYWGVADTVHWLLYGASMRTQLLSEGRYMVTKPLRRYWQKELWTKFFESLLNPPAKMQPTMPMQALAREFEGKFDKAAATSYVLKLGVVSSSKKRQKSRQGRYS